MKTLKQFLLTLFRFQYQKPAEPIPPLAPHIAKLKFIHRAILECLLWGRVRGNAYHPEAIVAASDLKEFLEKELDTSPYSNEKHYRSILEAGLVTFGRVDLIESVIEAIPDTFEQRQTGLCVAICSHALAVVLPLPEDFHCGYRKHCDKQKLKTWFNEHRNRLQWDTDKEYFVLRDGTSEG